MTLSAVLRYTAILTCVLFSFTSFAQKSRTITDNGKKFIYTDTGGVTTSYITHFGSSFEHKDLKTIDETVITKNELQNKVVVYNFWFVHCKPCVAEIPGLNKLKQKYNSDAVAFVGLSFDSPNAITEFLQRSKFDFTQSSMDQSQLQAFKKISFYPCTIIVDKSSTVRYVLFGKPMGKTPDEDVYQMLDAKLTGILKEDK